MTVTENELLDAIDGALIVSAGPAGAKTADEIRDAKGWGRDKVYKALEALGKQGRLGVHRVQRTTLDGRPCQVPAYTVLPKGTKK